MKILHISTFDAKGGAARSAYRLHRGLLSRGHDSKMFVNYRTIDDKTIIPFNPDGSIFFKLNRFFRRILIERDYNKYSQARSSYCSIFSDDRNRHGTAVVQQLPTSDIINLHWVAQFLDYRAFFRMQLNHKPLVWRLSDMNPFTGGCHLDECCGKYNSGCGSCPQLGSNHNYDLSHQVWKRKFALFSQIGSDRLHFIAQSHWMARKIKNSKMLHRFSCTIIPNGLDTDVFFPRNKQYSRELLGLPQEAKIVFFLANKISEGHKGFQLLKDALQRIAPVNDLILLTAGNDNSEVGEKIHQHHLGPVKNERYLSAVYSSADIFVIPSLQENLPNTVMEAMACGTPVVGFSVGGIPDMVREGVTGLLVPKGDHVKLGDAILGLLQDTEKRAEMSDNSRRIACDEYSLDLQTARYSAFYEKLLGNYPKAKSHKTVSYHR